MRPKRATASTAPPPTSSPAPNEQHSGAAGKPQCTTGTGWIGGSRPGNARFVPPPPSEVIPAMSDLEKVIHDRSARRQRTPGPGAHPLLRTESACTWPLSALQRTALNCSRRRHAVRHRTLGRQPRQTLSFVRESPAWQVASECSWVLSFREPRDWSALRSRAISSARFRLQTSLRVPRVVARSICGRPGVAIPAG